jgi:riboflavin synthase
MFTGIIEHVGRIQAFEKNAINKEALDKSAFGKAAVETAGDGGSQAGRLRVHAGPLAASLAISNSIAVNGCCLTVVEIAGETFAADLSSETLRRTSFGEITPGTPVNLERPMTAGKEFGGHFVQGHVDGIARVVRWEDRWEAGGATWWLGVRLPPELARYAAMKGSIAIDGISLTVANLAGDTVEAAIIPFTYANTNLQALRVGSAVNIETDILAKYVERILEARRPAATSSLSLERLIQEGF